ncbi:hypothetical protein ABIF50_007315 [Bradyrhizobium diazoefficiens]
MEIYRHGEGPSRPSCPGELFDERLFAGEEVELRPDLDRKIAGFEREGGVGVDLLGETVSIKAQPLAEQALVEGRVADQHEPIAVAGDVVGGAVEIPIGEQAVGDGHGASSCRCVIRPVGPQNAHADAGARRGIQKGGSSKGLPMAPTLPLRSKRRTRYVAVLRTADGKKCLAGVGVCSRLRRKAIWRMGYSRMITGFFDSAV